MAVDTQASQPGFPCLGPVIISAAEIQVRVKSIAAQIQKDHAEEGVRLVVTLKGAWVFAADLARAIQPEARAQIDFLQASSYGRGLVSSGSVHIAEPVNLDLAGERVVLVEDMVDSGRTVRAMLDHFGDTGAASIRIATLLSKPSRRTVEVPIHYLGFEVPDEFVVGYGMDWADQFRHLADIRVLRLPE